MAEKTLRVCDVTGKTKDVKTYVVAVRRKDKEWRESIIEHTVDFNPWALNRCDKFIGRAVAPTSARADDDGEIAKDRPNAATKT